jgi:DNA-binding HxlR family transcriptional regulator
MKLDGALAVRGNEPVDGYCPMERALRVVGTRSAILVLREAFYGATRFDEFTARTGLTDRATSARLRDFERAGIVARRAYRDPGQRQRYEYVLTQAGSDLMPAVFALLQWANEHDPPPYPPEVRHLGCGDDVRIVAECGAGHRVEADDLVVSASGPFGLSSPVAIGTWDNERSSTLPD